MKNELLRHTLSTILYRFNKSVANYKPAFSSFSLGKGSRTPAEIVNHMFLVIKSTRLFIERESRESTTEEVLSLDREIMRFLEELKRLDEVLKGKELPMNYSKRLLQGPLADVLTHIGQIAMLQRMMDNPIQGEDFSSASIETGIA